jgi:hypothetical protein
VSFTQRQCAERAQGLTSARIVSREQGREIQDALAGFRFDSPYGKEIKRFLQHGIGIHHAGLLPKYRLKVEQLAQRGLLKVICGTDTLGVGVNIPIRTVLFSQLCKFDGEKVAILRVREFQQIAGRAGRKGFDERGSVVCQAPEHVIENRRAEARAAAMRRRKPPKKRGPPRGMVVWNKDTFEKLIYKPPETLESRFRVDHGTVVNVLQRTDSSQRPGSSQRSDDGGRGGYADLIDLIDRSHERPAAKARLRRHAAVLFRSLRRAGIVEVTSGPNGPRARVAERLQLDFSLHHTHSLFLIDALAALDPDSPRYTLEVITLVEAILEDPRAILYAQERKAKGELVAQLKAQRVPYEDRIAKLDRISWPKPDAEFIRAAFAIFVELHPWLGEEDLHLKSIAREMFEDFRGFDDYTRDYGVARSEGLLLRYLSQVVSTLAKSVPDAAKTEGVHDAIAFFRNMIEQVDSSLVEAWETLDAPPEANLAEPPPFDLADHPRVLAARVRTELHALVSALSTGDHRKASECVRQDPDDLWGAARFEAALAPFFEEYAELVFTPDARGARRTLLRPEGRRRWTVFQVLVDPKGDDLWAIEGEVDLTRQRDVAGPLVRVRRVGP